MCIIAERYFGVRPTSVPNAQGTSKEEEKRKKRDRPGPDPNPNLWYNGPLQI
jgi:hypothetical protein